MKSLESLMRSIGMPILASTNITYSDTLFAQSNEVDVNRPPIELSFAMRNSYNQEVCELVQGQTNILITIAEKPVETRRATEALNWKLSTYPQKVIDIKGIKPNFKDMWYGETNDWFYPYPISKNSVSGENDVRMIKRERDDNGNLLPMQGPKLGKNAFGYYSITFAGTNQTQSLGYHNPFQLASVRYASVTPFNSAGDFEKNHTTPFNMVLLPEKRPIHSFLVHNLTSDGTPWTYVTGCVDTNGVPRSMVLQRSFGDITGPWQNAYTNSITAENPYGSISFVDGEAKGKSAFYRVVGMQEAAKAASQQTSTSNPAQ